MIKLESLREHLLAHVKSLKGNPDRLLTFIDAGQIRALGTPGDGFSYHYTVNIILTDFSEHSDTVFFNILQWVKHHQSDLFLWHRLEDYLEFEVDVLSNSAIDLSVKLKLTEDVSVTTTADGSYSYTHHTNPPFDFELLGPVQEK